MEPMTKTFTYKVAEGCAIKADVHEAGGNSSRSRAAVVFIHGGCLMMGSRVGHELLIDLLTGAGYPVISIDYRLAPETKLEPIIEDVVDAITWVRREGPSLFRVDPDRIAVMGESAGGYLTLMSGFAVSPPPKALVSFYGYGDIDGAWYSKPDPFYRRQPLVDRSAARSSVGTRVMSEVPRSHTRRLFYLYCRQNGLWPEEVSGHSPDSERTWFDRFCPVRNVTNRYPATLLLHGDIDTDVPYEQSRAMARKLESFGVDHELVTVPGRGHGFDDPGFSDPVSAAALDRILPFLARHV